MRVENLAAMVDTSFPPVAALPDAVTVRAVNPLHHPDWDALAAAHSNCSLFHTTIEYVKFDLRQGAFATETDNATGWHNRLFRALPQFISRMAGAALYRHCA